MKRMIEYLYRFVRLHIDENISYNYPFFLPLEIFNRGNGGGGWGGGEASWDFEFSENLSKDVGTGLCVQQD